DVPAAGAALGAAPALCRPAGMAAAAAEPAPAAARARGLQPGHARFRAPGPRLPRRRRAGAGRRAPRPGRIPARRARSAPLARLERRVLGLRLRLGVPLRALACRDADGGRHRHRHERALQRMGAARAGAGVRALRERLRLRPPRSQPADLLDCLDKYESRTCDSQFVDTKLAGWRYYRENFFTDDCVPKYFGTSLYPIDATACAQSILTLSRFGDAQSAVRVARWTAEHMVQADGSVLYQRRRRRVNAIPYVRWSAAGAFCALARAALAA